MNVTTDTVLQTPISYVGGTRRVARLWDGHAHGWKLGLYRTGIVLLMVGMWIVSTMFYAFMFGFAFLFIPWAIYTLNRRHHIHATQRAMLAGRTAWPEVMY